LTALFAFAELCRKITVVVIDTSTGTVGQVKEIALDDAFADTIFKLVYAIKAQPFDKKAYDDLLASVENTYSPSEIAEQSKDLSCIVAG
jgi:ubiquinone/menaquinone biosynthesis C-methylase UbiE